MIEARFIFIRITIFEGMFDDSAAKIFANIKDTMEDNQALSVLTVVGDRNVGKSTIASLLSGNSSMFYVSNLLQTTTRRNVEHLHQD